MKCPARRPTPGPRDLPQCQQPAPLVPVRAAPSPVIEPVGAGVVAGRCRLPVRAVP